MADLRDTFQKGLIAVVNEPIPGDSCVPAFCKGETFEITHVGHNDEDGHTYLYGGRFDLPIKATRCSLVDKNDNPYPFCVPDEWVPSPNGNGTMNLKTLRVLDYMKKNPGNNELVLKYLKIG